MVSQWSCSLNTHQPRERVLDIQLIPDGSIIIRQKNPPTKLPATTEVAHRPEDLKFEVNDCGILSNRSTQAAEYSIQNA